MSAYVGKYNQPRVVLLTECSMSDNVAVEHPSVDFVRPCNLCPHMKRITLANIRAALEQNRHVVEVDPAVAERARLGREDADDMIADFGAFADRPVIIGGGATALALARMPVVLVSKAPLGTATSSAWAQGGFASLADDDPPDLHFEDTVAAGDGLVDVGVARAVAGAAPGAVRALEFIQCHPTALATPARPMRLISEAVRGEGAAFIDDLGVHFMEGILGGELAPRDVVARAIWQRLGAGRLVFLDGRRKPGRNFGERSPISLHPSALTRKTSRSR